MREFIGGIAGGTLGYITAGVPGAIAGYKFGRRHGKKVSQMPVSRSRSRGRSLTRKRRRSSRLPLTRGRLPRARSRSVLSGRSRSRIGSLLRGMSSGRSHTAHGPDTSNTTRLPNVGRKKSKRVSFVKKKKKVHVSKKLRAKIMKVVDKKEAHGQFKEIGYQTAINNITNGQLVQTLSVTTSTSAGIGGTYFDPVRVLNAASILWNQKASNSVMTVTDPRNFHLQGLKIRVRNSYVRFTFKNNGQRVQIMKLFECAPKSVIPTANDQQLPNHWANCLSNEATGPLGSAVASVNPLANTNIALYMVPTSSKQFNQMFATETTKITLEPGQTYTHFMQGPRDFVYDYSKFFVNTAFCNGQKMRRDVMVVVHNDVVGFTDTGNVGGGNPGASRMSEGSSFDGAGIVYEAECVYKLAMPNLTGFTVPAVSGLPVGEPKELDFAHNVHAQVVYPPSTLSGASAPVRFDEENPVVIETKPE